MLKRDLGGVGFPHPGGLISGAVRQHHQNVSSRKTFDHGIGIFLGGLVDPLEVLDQQHQGAAPTFLEHHLAEDTVASGLDGLRTERRERLGAGFDAQQVE